MFRFVHSYARKYGAEEPELGTSRGARARPKLCSLMFGPFHQQFCGENAVKGESGYKHRQLVSIFRVRPRGLIDLLIFIRGMCCFAVAQPPQCLISFGFR